MRYWEDMDIAETAAAMGCSGGQCKNTLLPGKPFIGHGIEGKGHWAMSKERDFAYKVRHHLNRGWTGLTAKPPTGCLKLARMRWPIRK